LTENLTFAHYQMRTNDTAIYPGADQGTIEAVNYTVLGLAGEAAEICNSFKKALRDDKGKLTAERSEAIAKELGDVLWYVARLAAELGLPLRKIAQSNLEKLERRAAAGTISGSGDDR
jgi:NTP pyrophosphatase (non-canonical NTP hydrolase)